jgi:hypothetical protein
MLISTVIIVHPTVVETLKGLNDHGVIYDLKQVIDHYSSQVVDTHCRIRDLVTLDAVVRSVRSGVYGRASKTRYFLRVFDSTMHCNAYYPLFLKREVGNKAWWVVNYAVLDRLEENGIDTSDYCL